ncbi:hypothetical protein Glove_52g149 [Diversispora epigaea]|uniref:BTB domain-containing protein n=1 Tax=Diversispora epigaea TaxID=1348612 RepID=A0A397JK37_9GLOM|nr:hypothetical protein Glove_52g149 [Diversispora epigaea]
MTFRFFDKLSEDFSDLLNDLKDYNVVIEVDKEENKKSFTAHSVVLRCRSPYFDTELEKAIMENNTKTIILPNMSAQIFEIILKYIYGGVADIENSDTKAVYELMVWADKLDLKGLSVKLESYLIESKASWLKTHVSIVYHSIFDKNEFKGLKKFYNDIIEKHPNLIFESEDFTSLQETVLVSILKRDDLKVGEIKIWDYVIKWGIAQNPTLPTNSKEWSKENFQTLKITLQQCLPLIRYFHIPYEDIWEKVKPYRKILEKQLWDDMIQHHMSPNKPIKSLILPARNPPLRANSTHIPSTFPPPVLHLRSQSTPVFSSLGVIELKKEHVAELASWIDRKETIYSLSNIPYEFKLILRGSRDGFNPKTFWKMCHGYSGTIVVAKVAGTDEIIGGYNPSAWDNSTGGRKIKTNDSFIFSLKNGNIQNSILSRVKKDSKEALYYFGSHDQKSSGPSFGNGEFMMKSDVSDFTKEKQCRCWHGLFNCYKKPIRKTSDFFSIKDYEVFEVVKKPIPNATDVPFFK